MSFIVIVGYQGRMSRDLQNLLTEQKLDYKIFSSKAPADLRVESFEGASGVIDFSKPEAAEKIAKLVSQAKVPWVCGTTAWPSIEKKNQILKLASDSAPVLVDSNFSFGIEILCRTAENLAESLSGPFFIIDYHHQFKKDSPSGTALKIAERMREKNPKANIEFRDIRAGQIAGEHQIFVAWEQESLQFTHRAQSRRVFSEGALRALKWLQNQKPGLYSMRDIP